MRQQPGRWAWTSRLGDLLGAAIYGDFMYRYARYYAASGRLLGLLFTVQLAAASLVFLLRRRPRAVTNNPVHYLVALVAAITPLIVEPAGYRWSWQVPLGGWIQGIALALWAWSFLSLGRSFGVVAADRGIKSGGPYHWVRHPLYLSYMIGGAGYVLQSFSLFNAAALAFADTILVVRLVIEERYLTAISGPYREYVRNVRSHLLPGVW